MSNDNETFTITVTMKKRWIPHFLGMLDYMQKLGNWGGSRKVSIYSDGDGDFRPKFEFDKKYEIAKPIENNDGNTLYDAG